MVANLTLININTIQEKSLKRDGSVACELKKSASLH